MLSPLDLEVIDLAIEIEDGKVVNTKSSGNRLRGYEKVFIGKNPKELYSIIPRVLSTCAQSHVFAYAKASMNLSKNTSKILATMVILEIIESHIRHPYTYWFPYIGGREYDFPSGDKFKKISFISKQIRNLMERVGGKWPSVDYFNIGKKIQIEQNEINKIREMWERETLGMGVEDFLEVEEIEELKGDLSLFKKIPYFISGLNKYLTVGFPFNGDLDYSKIQDNGIEVKYDGELVEVGPLAQALTFDKMVRKLHEKIGPSPMLRELSRMKIVAHLLNQLNEINEETDGFSIRGDGVGIVESIRGSLIHDVQIDSNIKGYKIIQPTTFNASPKGALEKAVNGIPVSNPKNPWEISLAVSSLDSCFVTEVRIFEKGNLVSKKRIGGFC